MVTMAGNPSGIIATANAIATINISINKCPRTIPTINIKTVIATAPIAS